MSLTEGIWRKDERESNDPLHLYLVEQIALAFIRDDMSILPAGWEDIATARERLIEKGIIIKKYEEGK